MALCESHKQLTSRMSEYNISTEHEGEEMLLAAATSKAAGALVLRANAIIFPSAAPSIGAAAIVLTAQTIML